MASSCLGSGTSVTKGTVVAGTPGLQAHPISALVHLRARESQARRRGPSPHPRAGCVNHWAVLTQPWPCRKQADSWGWARVPGCGRVEAGSPS